jgi:hypothetical protein
VLSISSVLTEDFRGFLQSPTNSAVVFNADVGGGIDSTVQNNENLALVGYYEARFGNFLPTFRDNMSVFSNTLVGFILIVIFEVICCSYRCKFECNISNYWNTFYKIMHSVVLDYKIRNKQIAIKHNFIK